MGPGWSPHETRARGVDGALRTHEWSLGGRVASKPALPPASCQGPDCVQGCPQQLTLSSVPCGAWGRPKAGGEASQAKGFILPWALPGPLSGRVGVAMVKGPAGPTGGRGSRPQNQGCTLFARGVSTRNASWPQARGSLQAVAPLGPGFGRSM